MGGRSHPQPHAIIQLSEGPKAKAVKSDEERKKIEEELTAYMAEVNKTLDAHECLVFLAIVKDDWLPENGFLTPTQKIKRATIEDIYNPQVEGWYAARKKVVWVGDW